MVQNDFDFVKTIYSWGMGIEDYVKGGAITADQYKQITGKDYVAA
ncbi:XkdX family protein [uncultured Limosilactobacillus sp.]|nr:XkdX family protein [uncultured Limosilactobacillus sp.]